MGLAAGEQQPYDPVYAHQYYEDHKQLKGTSSSSTSSSSSTTSTRSSAPPPKPKTPVQNKVLTSPASARVGRLKEKVQKLQDALNAAVAELAKKKAAERKTEKENSDGKSTVKEKQSSKEYRDKNQAKINEKARQESAKDGGSTSTSAPSNDISSMNSDQLGDRIVRLKKALTEAKQQLSAATQSLGGLAHGAILADPEINQSFAHFRSEERNSVKMPDNVADFSGWATRADTKCTDGRTILQDAFKSDHGNKVPLVFQHNHNDINNVLGYVELENRPEGVYCKGYFNQTTAGQNAKEQVKHGDLRWLSIFANNLIEKAQSGLKAVVHGSIREVSLVLAGANPGAYIDNVSVVHSDGEVDVILEEAIITSGYDIELSHAEAAVEEKAPTKEEPADDDLEAILESLTPKQEKAVEFLLYTALNEKDGNSAQHSEDLEGEDSFLEHGPRPGTKGEAPVTADQLWFIRGGNSSIFGPAAVEIALKVNNKMLSVLSAVSKKYKLDDNDIAAWKKNPAAENELFAGILPLLNGAVGDTKTGPSGTKKLHFYRDDNQVGVRLVDANLKHSEIDDEEFKAELQHGFPAGESGASPDALWLLNQRLKGDSLVVKLHYNIPAILKFQDSVVEKYKLKSWREIKKNSAALSEYLTWLVNYFNDLSNKSKLRSPDGKKMQFFRDGDKIDVRLIDETFAKHGDETGETLGEDLELEHGRAAGEANVDADAAWVRTAQALGNQLFDKLRPEGDKFFEKLLVKYKIPKGERASNYPEADAKIDIDIANWYRGKLNEALKTAGVVSPSGKKKMVVVRIRKGSQLGSIEARIVDANMAHSDIDGEELYELSQEADLEAGDAVQHDQTNQEDNSMTHNMFDQAARTATTAEGEEVTLSHSDVQGIMREVVENETSLKAVMRGYALEHGITNIEYLFPDAKNLDNSPQWDARRQEWVTKVLDGVRKAPFARIRSIVADITAEEARAKGYITGNMKKEEFFSMARRDTYPQTIYKKQKLNRDEVIDITDLDVVSFVKGEMKVMLDEEIASAILIGDGRSSGDDDKIKENNVRPIATDVELYVTQAYVNIEDNGSTIDELIDAVTENRQYYKGSGTPTFYTSEYVIAKFLNLKDGFNRRMYNSLDEVATVLRVKEIQPVDVFDRTPNILGIMVNLTDYTIGTDRGGQATMFDDFDLNYNKLLWLLETRLSGALTKPKCAVVFNKTASTNTLVAPDAPSFNKSTWVVTIPSKTGVVYKNKDTGATLTAGAQTALTAGQTLNVHADPASTYYFANNKGDDWSYTRPAA